MKIFFRKVKFFRYMYHKKIWNKNILSMQEELSLVIEIHNVYIVLLSENCQRLLDYNSNKTMFLFLLTNL